MNILLDTGDKLKFKIKDTGEVKIGYVQLAKGTQWAGIHLIENGELSIYPLHKVLILERL